VWFVWLLAAAFWALMVVLIVQECRERGFGVLLGLKCADCGERIKRADKDTTRIRNEFVAALADRVFVAHAASGGKTEIFCQKVLGWGKPLMTFKDPSNIALHNLGALPFSGLDDIGS